MSGRVTVVRLPGAGMIVEGPASEIPWLSYRRQRIDAAFYRRFVSQLSSAPKAERFLVISGGLGSHLYINLARDLGLDEEMVGRVARHHIREMQEMIRIFAADRGVEVHGSQIPISRLAQIVSERASRVIFVEPSSSHDSTDELAANVARISGAHRLLFFKARTPSYTVGFDTATCLTTWRLDDMIRRASRFESRGGGSYILSRKALEIIKGLSCDVRLVSPECPESLSDFPHPEYCTVISP